MRGIGTSNRITYAAKNSRSDMTNKTLAQGYRIKALKRMKILEVLLREEAYSDVVREAQEIVELALRGMLRRIGVEPPNGTAT